MNNVPDEPADLAAFIAQDEVLLGDDDDVVELSHPPLPSPYSATRPSPSPTAKPTVSVAPTPATPEAINSAILQGLTHIAIQLERAVVALETLVDRGALPATSQRQPINWPAAQPQNVVPPTFPVNAQGGPAPIQGVVVGLPINPNPTGWVCPVHGGVKIVPAGVSARTQKAYPAFAACPEQGCKQKPPR